MDFLKLVLDDWKSRKVRIAAAAIVFMNLMAFIGPKLGLSESLIDMGIKGVLGLAGLLVAGHSYVDAKTSAAKILAPVVEAEKKS